MAKYDTAGVPTVIDEIRTPQRHSDVHYDPQPPENIAGGIETVAHLIVGVLVGLAMYWTKQDALWALGAGVGYYAGMTTLRILARTDTIKDVVRAMLDFFLEWHRVNALVDLEHRRFDMLEAQDRHRAPLPIAAETPHESPARNYVPPYQPEIIDEAVAYAESLYNADGYIDPRRVHANGRVRGQVIGSKRGGGSRAAQQYLIDRGFLGVGRGGYWVNMQKFGSIVELARLRR